MQSRQHWEHVYASRPADRVSWHQEHALQSLRPIGDTDVALDASIIDPADRRAYVDAVIRAVKPGGHVIVATFAEDGPAQCSGLPVQRYSAAGLHAEIGPSFALLRHEREEHHTPGGAVRRFAYCYCRRGVS